MAKATSKSRAANIGDMWNKKKSEAKSSAFGEAVPVEPGKYNFQIVSAEIGDFGGARQVMTKFCVVGDFPERGAICTTWNSLEEDRIVWTQRLLTSMGVDLDEAQVETEEDLMGIFEELINNQTVCAGKVREKDGYTNLYINQVVDVDSADLVDPEEALKAGASPQEGKPAGGKPSSGGKPTQTAKPDDDAVEVEVGNRVSWKDGKATVEGEIVAFDKDDNAIVRPDGSKKTVTKALDSIELLGAPAGADIEVGSTVKFKVGKKEHTGEVKKVKGGKATVETDETIFDDVNLDDLELVDAPAAEPVEVEKGDEVEWQEGKKTLRGVVTKVDGDTAKVKADTGSVHELDVSKLSKVDEAAADAGAEEAVEKGDEVEFKLKGKKLSGVVTKVKDGTLTVKTPTGSVDVDADIVTKV